MVHEAKITLKVRARDQPGELVRILRPLSDNNANIHGVFHEHEQEEKDQSGLVPVEISFTFGQSMGEDERKDKLEKIKAALQSEGIEIHSISMESLIKRSHVIFIGHVFDTDIRDSIIQLSSTGVNVLDLKASLQGTGDTSTVMLTVAHEGGETEHDFLAKVDEIAAAKSLKYITS